MSSIYISLQNAPAILNLPPEILLLITSNIPLQHSPATLSALALTSKSLYPYVNPVLYSKVIIKKAEYTSQILDRISTNKRLGLVLQELHIRINPWTELPKRRSDDSTVFFKLQEVIENGDLPHLKYLSLVLLKSSHYPGIYESKLLAEYVLPHGFWTSLRRFCPLLRGIRAEGIDDSPTEPWVNEPKFYDLKDFLGLRAISLKYNYGFPSEECSRRLCQNLISIASTLQSLSLFFEGKMPDAESLLSITLPHLKSLRISGFYSSCVTTDHAMAFWARHQSLEQVDVYSSPVTGCRLFSDRVAGGLLPRLARLRARFDDVRAMTTHLGQLERLCIVDSYNCQVPYLLRAVLPDGLPKLKSFEIHQTPCSETFISFTEGAMWYETEDGNFLQELTPKAARKCMDSSYMHSIVQGAPNLEELCLHSQNSPPNMDMLQISPILGQLRSLERLYFSTFPHNQSIADQTDKVDFMSKCRVLGDSCRSLKTVTDVGGVKLGPYLVGKIVRDDCGGSVKEVVPSRGFGMELSDGGGVDPFPLNIPS